MANKAIKKINTVNAIKPAVQEPASKKPGVKRPMPMARILITYPSTKAGASPQQLKEYAAIEAKYINATETTKFIKKSDIAAADRAKMEELFAKMSKEQQYKQMIAFSFGMPFPKNVPTQAQLDTWANDRQYKITIDSKLSSGAELAKYKAADFSYFYKAHIEWQVHRKYKYQHYEIQLMTTPYFNAKNKDRVENSFVFNNMQPPLRVAKPVSSKNEKAAIEVEQPAAAVVTKINYIIITGEVMYPGTYPTQKGEIYLQEYLKRAGGITTHGSAENVRVYRGGKLVNTGLSTGNSESILLPGDSIYVARL